MELRYLMEKQNSSKQRYYNFLIGGLILSGLYLLSAKNYILFHSLAEGFAILLATAIFIVAWNSRRFFENHFLLFIAVAYLFVALIDLIHSFSYKGIGSVFFPGADANLPTQLWIAARYLQTASLVIAPAFLTRKINFKLVFFDFAAAAGLLLFSIFYLRNFPDAFIENEGLTAFKKISEYVISLMLAGSIFFLFKKRRALDPSVFKYVVWSIIFAIAAELSFTEYANVYGTANMIGHLLRIVSIYLMYEAVVTTGLRNPFSILFRGLKQSEQKFSSLFTSAMEGVAIHEIVYDPDGKAVDYILTEVNPAYETITGLKKSDVIGKKASVVYGTGSAPYLDIFSTAASTGKARSFETYFEPMKKHFNVSVFSPAKGKFVTAFEDITDRKQNELKIIRAKQEWEKTFDSVPDLIAIIDTNHRIQRVNKPMAERLGLKPEQCIGLSCHECVHRSDSPPLICPHRLSLADGQEHVAELREDNLGGDFLISTTPFFDENGHITGSVHVARDITERKKIERTLIENQRFIQHIMSTTPDIIYIFDLHQRRLIYVNRNISELVGWDEKEIEEMKVDFFEKIILPDDLAKIKALAPDLQLTQNGQIFEIDFRIRDNQGDIRWIHSHNTVFLRDNDNSVIQILGTAEDFSEREKNREERERLMIQLNEKSRRVENLAVKLKKERDSLKIIMENTKAQLAFLDPDFNFITVNSAYAIGCGHAPSELIGKNHFYFFPDEENEKIFKKVKDAGRAVEFKAKPFVFPDQPGRGTTYWDWTLMPIKSYLGQVTGFVLSLMDVTEQKIAHEKIAAHAKEVQREKVKDEAILSSIGHGVVATDVDGKILFSNDGFEHLSGFAKKELIGTKLFETVKIQNDNGHEIINENRPFFAVLSSGRRAGNIKCFCVRKDSTKIPVAITATPIILDGKTTGMISVYRDITKEKEVDRAKTEFVSLASHQLRTPLTSISLASEMLLGGMAGETNKEQKKYLRAIYGSVKEMTDIIEALLNISRIEMGALLISPEPASLAKIMDETISLVAIQIEDRELTLIKNYENDLPEIEIDKKLMRLVLDNLISNALKYTAPGGTISVEIKKRERDALIVVSDTGCGIPAHQQSQIFTKLFRADNKLKRETKGTGLGLYIVKSAVAQYGGKIWFKSEENNGTTFYVTVPLKGMKRKDKLQEKLFGDPPRTT